ncbi:hypothetical protein BC827DRAFT_1170336 [Russula dissimulans]|nr:hypothetical protein BC827DRAFT_1170336 [Russula dissimulans]
MDSDDSEDNKRENKDRIATGRISKARKKDGKGSSRPSAHSNPDSNPNRLENGPFDHDQKA